MKREKKWTGNELAELFAALTPEDIPDSFDALTKALKLREVTTDELTLVLGITDRRISQLWQDGIIPEPRKDGRRHWFPLLASIRGYIDFLRDK